jgi:uncharacterized protein YndB with AHSA1/START domain
MAASAKKQTKVKKTVAKTARKKAATRGRAARPSRTIAIERFVRAEPAKLWTLFTTPAGLERWIATSADVDLREGGRIGMVMRGDCGAGTATENRILALEPERRLELEWERTAQWGPTHVAVTFAPARGGTRVRLVQSGFGDGPEWDEWYEGFDGGWAALLAQLVSAAEGGGSRSAELQERVPGSVNEVWNAIASAKGLGRWFTGKGGVLEKRAGGRYELEAGPVTIAGEVREFSPGRTLAITWGTEPCTQKNLSLPTVVTFHLTPLAAGGTCVSLVHSGFGDGPEWDEIYARHAATWKFLLGNLKSVVAYGVDQRGRSIERSLLVRAKRAEAFRLFTTKAGIESWFAQKAEIGTRPGDPCVLTFGAPEHAETMRAPGRIAEVQENERFVFVWASPSSGKRTLVTVNFREEPSGTRITIVESGFGADSAWDSAYLDNSQGWGYELDKLFAVVEGLGERGRSITIDEEIAASPEAVWRALSTSKGISAWWEKGEIDARLGGSYRFGDARGEVREVVVERALSLTWDGSAAGPELPAATLVTFVLAPHAGGTRLSLIHAGFGRGGAWEKAWKIHVAGWARYVKNLVAHVSS